MLYFDIYIFGISEALAITSVCEKTSVLLPSNIKTIWIKTGIFVFLKMQHITGISRNQMTFSCLEDTISADNPIRFIDAFAENIELKTLGFEVKGLKSEGRPSFDTEIFFKLYLYGYLNGLPSSLKLEKERLRNTETQGIFC